MWLTEKCFASDGKFGQASAPRFAITGWQNQIGFDYNQALSSHELMKNEFNRLIIDQTKCKSCRVS